VDGRAPTHHAPPGKSDRLDAHAVARLLREETETLPPVLAEEPEVATVQLWSSDRGVLSPTVGAATRPVLALDKVF
jgi:hypothetical protein